MSSTARNRLASEFCPEKIREASANQNAKFFQEMWKLNYVTDDIVWEHLLSARDESRDRFSPLHIAVVLQYEEVVKAILAGSGRDTSKTYSSQRKKFEFIHARTSKGWTALHLAIAVLLIPGSRPDEILDVLIGAYDSIEKVGTFDLKAAPFDFADCCWMTPLHYAVLGNLQTQVRMLLKWELYGKHVNARDFYRRTPLHMASCHQPVPVEPFLECTTAKVDFRAIDCVRHSPLHWAICFAREEVVDVLVEKLKDAEAIDVDIEGRSFWDIITGHVLVRLDEGTFRDQLKVPQKVINQSDFLMEQFELIRGDVRTKIRSHLQRIPAVRAQAERTQKSMQMYVSAISAIIVAASLIASASFAKGSSQSLGQGSSQETDIYDGWSQPLLTAHILLMSGAFYIAILALIASFVTLHSLGKVFPGRAQLKNIRFGLKGITQLLGWSITCFLSAFYVSNIEYISVKRVPSILYHFFSVVGISWCLLYVLVMPYGRQVSSPHEYRQLNLKPGYANDLLSQLYSPEVREKWYWGLWQTECEATNAIRAYSVYLVPSKERLHRDRSGDNNTATLDEKMLCNFYSRFLRDIFGLPNPTSTSSTTRSDHTSNTVQRGQHEQQLAGSEQNQSTQELQAPDSRQDEGETSQQGLEQRSQPELGYTSQYQQLWYRVFGNLLAFFSVLLAFFSVGRQNQIPAGRINESDYHIVRLPGQQDRDQLAQGQEREQKSKQDQEREQKSKQDQEREQKSKQDQEREQKSKQDQEREQKSKQDQEREQKSKNDQEQQREGTCCGRFCMCFWGEHMRPDFFCPPSFWEGLCMGFWNIFRHLQEVDNVWTPMRPLLFPLLWNFQKQPSGVAFQKYVVCALLGGHFAESYYHGRLYSSKQGSDQSSQQRSGHSSQQGSGHSSQQGSGHSSQQGSGHSSQQGSVHSLQQGSGHSSQQGSGQSSQPADDYHAYAKEIWRRLDVPEKIITRFMRMAYKIRRVEETYEKWMKQMDVNSRDGEVSRHFRYFLARLPRGILYWVNIWMFPKSRRCWSRGMFYWLNFWFTNWEVVPRKFPIVTFYQGYVFQRDVDRREGIMLEIQEKKNFYVEMRRPGFSAVVQNEARSSEILTSEPNPQ